MFSFKRLCLLGLSLLILSSMSFALAQDTTPPAVLNAAIDEMNRLIPGIGRPDNWQWRRFPADERNLGCEITGAGAALPAPVTVYRINLSYGAQVYTFHVTEDGSMVVPCDADFAAFAPTPTTAPPISLPPIGGGVAYAGSFGLLGSAPSGSSGIFIPSLPPEYGYVTSTCVGTWEAYARYLAIDGYARVLPGPPNNVRTSYGVENPKVGEWPAGTVIYILAGPECTPDGYIWWKAVDKDGLSGWTVELNVDDDRYLEPVAVGVGGTPAAPATTGPTWSAPIATQPITAASAAALSRVASLSLDWGEVVAFTNPNGIASLVAMEGAARTPTFYEILSDNSGTFSLSPYNLAGTFALTNIIDASSGLYRMPLGFITQSSAVGLLFNDARNGIMMQLTGGGAAPPYNDIAANSNGLVAVASGNTADPGIIGAADIWQVAGIGGGSVTYLANLPQPNAARYVAFSPDNLYLAVMDMNNIRLYETVNWSAALDLPVGAQGSELAFVPTLTDTSTRLLYGSGGNLVIWDLFAGRSQVAAVVSDATATITHIAPHPFGDLAAVVARGSGLTTLAIVDINNATVLYRENYPDSINSIAFDTSGYFLFVSNAGRNVSIYR